MWEGFPGDNYTEFSFLRDNPPHRQLKEVAIFRGHFSNGGNSCLYTEIPKIHVSKFIIIIKFELTNETFTLFTH